MVHRPRALFHGCVPSEGNADQVTTVFHSRMDHMPHDHPPSLIGLATLAGKDQPQALASRQRAVKEEACSPFAQIAQLCLYGRTASQVVNQHLTFAGAPLEKTIVLHVDHDFLALCETRDGPGHLVPRGSRHTHTMEA